MITGILLYCCTFLITAAVNIQARNAVAGKYIQLFITSIFISTLNIFLLKTMPTIDNFWHGACYIIGGGSGAIVGIFLHKWLKRKNYNKIKNGLMH
jgi:hypothetical protein